MFKKKKIQNNKKNNKIINIFGLIVILFVFILGVYTLSFAKQFNFFDDIGGVGEIENENLLENLKNDKSNDKINILLLGRGGITNDAPNLTDSIILASINKKSKIITMFSIPRDLYVKNFNGKLGKINSVYATFYSEFNDVDTGVDALKYNIEEITGEKVDYYVNIDFDGFVQFIDAIGGVQIKVENTLIDNEFPDSNWGYRTLIIKKGLWLFDGATALSYARSRHSTSDFDRSLRQQQIVEAVKEKLMEGGFFTKLNKAKKFYEVFQKYVFTDIGLADALTIFNEVNDSGYKIISSNLNNTCFEGSPLCEKGGFLYTPERSLFGGASVLLVNGSNAFNLDKYDEIKYFTSLIFNNPTIYKENFLISVLNSTKIPFLASDLSFELRKYGFNIPNDKYSVSTLKGELFEKSIINYKEEVGNSETIKILKESMSGFEFKEVLDLEYNLDPESKIEIIIGNNYNEVFSTFDENFNNNLLNEKGIQ